VDAQERKPVWRRSSLVRAGIVEIRFPSFQGSAVERTALVALPLSRQEWQSHQFSAILGRAHIEFFTERYRMSFDQAKQIP
jgi:hypothetical protein